METIFDVQLKNSLHREWRVRRRDAFLLTE